MITFKGGYTAPDTKKPHQVAGNYVRAKVTKIRSLSAHGNGK